MTATRRMGYERVTDAENSAVCSTAMASVDTGGHRGWASVAMGACYSVTASHAGIAR